jgi:hypothetical protein
MSSITQVAVAMLALLGALDFCVGKCLTVYCYESGYDGQLEQ